MPKSPVENLNFQGGGGLESIHKLIFGGAGGGGGAIWLIVSRSCILQANLGKLKATKNQTMFLAMT